MQALIDSGWISFKEDKPSVVANPLAGHASSSANAIMEEEGHNLVREVNMIHTPVKKQENECSCHPGISHSVDGCPKFKRILQDLIDRHILQIYRQDKEEEYSCKQVRRRLYLALNPW